MGVSSHHKKPVKPGQFDSAPCADTAAERLGSRLLGLSPTVAGGENQALALLSAVRSERSA
jgi:hypothetical protein